MSRIWDCGGTGNTVADYTEEACSCEKCHGTGLVPATFEQIQEEVACNAFFRRRSIDEQVSEFLTPKPFWKDMLKPYREWKENDRQIMCEKCNGYGTWTARY